MKASRIWWRGSASRRGSTLVMVAIMLVAFVGVGAIAADVGRFYVVTGELQTAADAAALSGGRTIQQLSGSNLETKVDSAVMQFVANTNRADNGTALTVSVDSVRTAYYTPGTGGAAGTVDFILNGRRPNAVVVGISDSTKGVIAQLIGQVTKLGLSRQATSWVGNVGSNCVRPWAFPYKALVTAVNGVVPTTTPAPALDAVGFQDYMGLDNSQRMFTIIGQNQSGAGVPPNDGEWTGFNFTGNAGKPGFTDGIGGCFDKEVGADASTGVTLPGQANQYVTWANSAISPAVCKLRNKDAGCYPSATSNTPGVPINSAWGELIGVGSNGINFRYVGQFMLTCYFTGPGDTCPASGSKPVGTAMTGYPAGTIVGYMMGLKDNIITPDDIVGNVPSNKQRLLLVK